MDKQIEAFEKYHRKYCAEVLGMHPEDIESEFNKDSEGNYRWGAAQDGWAYWKACAQQYETEIERLKSDYMKMLGAYERCDSELRSLLEQSNEN